MRSILKNRGPIVCRLVLFRISLSIRLLKRRACEAQFAGTKPSPLFRCHHPPSPATTAAGPLSQKVWGLMLFYLHFLPFRCNSNIDFHSFAYFTEDIINDSYFCHLFGWYIALTQDLIAIYSRHVSYKSLVDYLKKKAYFADAIVLQLSPSPCFSVFVSH